MILIDDVTVCGQSGVSDIHVPSHQCFTVSVDTLQTAACLLRCYASDVIEDCLGEIECFLMGQKQLRKRKLRAYCFVTSHLTVSYSNVLVLLLCCMWRFIVERDVTSQSCRCGAPRLACVARGDAAAAARIVLCR